MIKGKTQMNKQEFGLLLRKTRQAKGLTLRAFCKKIEKSPTVISKIERGLFDFITENLANEINNILEDETIKNHLHNLDYLHTVNV